MAKSIGAIFMGIVLGLAIVGIAIGLFLCICMLGVWVYDTFGIGGLVFGAGALFCGATVVQNK